MFFIEEMNGLIVIVLILILLLSLFLIIRKQRKLQCIGGYAIPYTFQRPGQWLGVQLYNKVKNGEMDNYCKAIACYFFDKNGYPSRSMKYIDGGKIAESIDEINAFITKRSNKSNPTLLTSTNSFIPDYAIYDDERLLIVEFDEGDSFHQSLADERYIAKNFIYDQILCQSYQEPINVCILRIKYNEYKYKSSERTIIGNFKEKGVRYIVSMMLFAWAHMKAYTGNKTYFQSQYILGYLDVKEQNDLVLKEFIGLIPKNYEDLNRFSPSSTFYSKINLDDYHIYEQPVDIRKWHLKELLRNELWTKYNGSKYERYVKSKINTTLTNNKFNEIIDHFNDNKFALK